MTKAEANMKAFFAFRDREVMGPLEKKLCKMLQNWHSIMPTRWAVYNHVFLCNGTGVEWKNGTLIGISSTHECKLNKKYAEELWGWSHYQSTVSGYVSWAPLYNIPANATEEAVMLAQEYCYMVLTVRHPEYKAYLTGVLASYTGTAYSEEAMVRYWTDLFTAQEACTKLATDRGWDWMIPKKAESEPLDKMALARKLIAEVMEEKLEGSNANS